jgi:GxxExxY protein
MAVHNALGPGYKEEVYERALAVELAERGIPMQRQRQMEVFHQGIVVALFIVDLWVEEAVIVIVEIKAFSHQLANDEIAQVVNYLKASGAAVGLLFNFGRRKLEYKRIFPPTDASRPVERLGRDNVKKSS